MTVERQLSRVGGIENEEQKEISTEVILEIEKLVWESPTVLNAGGEANAEYFNCACFPLRKNACSSHNVTGAFC